MSESSIRPTKKQRELLSFIEKFIGQHGYSPSYREIMNGLNYTSVATVALHVNSLIRRGHLRKRDRSARSLEVVAATDKPVSAAAAVAPGDEKWLVDRIEQFFQEAEAAEDIDSDRIAELGVLVSSLKLLGLQEAASGFAPRLKLLDAKALQDAA